MTFTVGDTYLVGMHYAPSTKGEAVALLRRSEGLTQAELGKLLGVDNTRVSQWETGYRTPGDEWTRQLARVFRVRESVLTYPTELTVAWWSRRLGFDVHPRQTQHTSGAA